MINGHAGALAMVAGRLGRHLTPPESMPLSQYLERHLVLIDGPFAGQLWTALGAPYLREIADCLGDDHPCNRVVVRKSQQTGVSILALGWMLYIAAAPAAISCAIWPGRSSAR